MHQQKQQMHQQKQQMHQQKQQMHQQVLMYVLIQNLKLNYIKAVLMLHQQK